ncbi:MAG: putative porin [Flavobacteriaceae bacterium]|nr:putative porin [Flavobacteriaceae bacterium]
MIKKLILVIFLIFSAFSTMAQIIRPDRPSYDNRFIDNDYDTGDPYDTTRVDTKEIEVKLSGKTYYKDYKIIDYKKDTIHIDTTLNIKGDYTFNYLRKDNLELMAFANQGQTFTTLAHTFNNYSTYPKIGARAQHFNFFEVEDVLYYHVPTPTTQLMYKKGMEQGQVLNAIFTFNTSERLNTSISFKGMRSLGKYRHSLSNHGNARFSISYNTENERYFIRTHIVAQDLNNDQNGGLTDESIDNFESGNAQFKDRNRLVTNFTDAKSILRGNRYFLDHTYKLWGKNDTLRTIPSELKVGHVFNFERKNYEYEQDAANPIFGSAFTSSIKDRTKYSKFFNEVYVSLNSPITLGEVKFKVNNFNYKYEYNSILISDDQIIESNLNGNSIALGGEWHTQFKKLNLNVDASTIISGNLNGYNMIASIDYVKDSLLNISAHAFRNSRSPNLNFQLYQSGYKKYNWQNNFNNEETTGIGFIFDSKKWGYASVDINNINNYTYFNAPAENGQTKPIQSSENINYLKVKISKEFRLGHFALDNQFIYQNVSSGSDVFRVPDFITRNTLYYQNHLFKGRPLYIQTGVTFSYFSKYYMNSYNPVLSEFYLQNEQEIGGYPVFDLFLNMRIRTMQIFLKLQHFNSSFSENNYYSAPSYPYRDLSLRFGIIWTFFI